MDKTIQQILKEDYLKWYDKDYIFTRTEDRFIPKTFGRTIDDVLAISEYLLSLGLENKNIAIYGVNSYEWMVSDLAAMGYVGVSVTLDKSWTFYDVANALKLTEIKCLIYSPSQEAVVKLLKKNFDILYISTGSDFQYALEKGRKILENKKDKFDFKAKAFDKMSKIVFSSGTTGNPKAVMLSQKNMLMGFENLMRRAPMTEDDSCFLFLPLHHTYAGLYNFLFSIISGISIYICSDNSKIAEEIMMANPTIVSVVPLILERFFNAVKDKKSYAKALFGKNIKYVFCGGVKLDNNIKEFFQNSGLDIIEAYALSETASSLSIQYSGNHNPESVGIIFDNIEVKISEPDSEGVGEILVRGDNVFLGYFNNKEATDDAFDENSFFKTGDLGKIDEKNNIYLTGRKKRIILMSNGENVYPEEIEALICEYNEVTKAKILYEDGEIKAKLYINKNADIARIIDSVNEKLPKYSQISSFEAMDDSIDNRIK